MRPLCRTGDADRRVLLLDDHPGSMSAEVDELIAAELRRSGAAVDLDAIRRPRSALKVIAGNPSALAAYDAVVAISAPRSARAAGAPLARSIARLAERLPTLLVEIRPRDEALVGARLLEHATEPAPSTAEVLVLAVDVDPASVARRITAALQAILERSARRAGAADSRMRRPGPSNGVDPRFARRLAHIVKLTGEALEQPTAEVNLVRGGDLVTVASTGPARSRQPVQDTLCAIALRRPGVTIMADTWLDADACRVERTRGPDAIRFYAAAAIVDRAGRRIGVLCAYGPDPQPATDLDVDFLRDLALLAEGELIEATALSA